MATLRRIRWRPDEDQLLFRLREENPQSTWEDITERFNLQVGIERKRTEDGVKGRINK
jgi:hypothetical protein